MQTSVLLKYILLILFFFHLEWFSLFLCSFPTWGDLHGCSAVGTVIWTVLCGLMWNDWGVQVYLSFAVRFTFFRSFLLSVCSFTLGSLRYFSYYLWDNCCNAYIVEDILGGELVLSARQMLFHCHQKVVCRFNIYDSKLFFVFFNLWFHICSHRLTSFLSLDASRTFLYIFGQFFQVLTRSSLLLASSHDVTCTSAPIGDGHFTQGGCSMDQSHHPWRKPGYRPTRPHW